MILYRLAKWMEERKRLKRLIADTDGDSAGYVKQKADVERLMIRETYKWLEPEKASGNLALVVREQEQKESYPLALAQISAQERLPSLEEILTDLRRSSLETAKLTGPLRAEDVIPEELLHMPLVVDDTLQQQQL